MIGLASPGWNRFQHAYGPATNIPPLLQQLIEISSPTHDYMDEPWFSLWSALCHQGDVFVASEMIQSYFDSLQKLHLLAFVHSTEDWNSDMAQSVAAALAASKGQIELAQALISLDSNIIRKINAADW